MDNQDEEEDDEEGVSKLDTVDPGEGEDGEDAESGTRLLLFLLGNRAAQDDAVGEQSACHDVPVVSSTTT